MIKVFYQLLAVSLVVTIGYTLNVDKSRTSVSGRIVGGFIATDGQFPYQVSIKRNGSHWCGGSIIDNTTILSAAHCFYNLSGEFQVVVGSNRLDLGGDLYGVNEIRNHEGYNQDTFENDIAILKLASEIVYGLKVQPIGILHEPMHRPVWYTLSGWGLTRWVGPYNLRYVYLRSITNGCCQRMQPDHTPILESHLCTYNSVGQGACFGDSGGALTVFGKIVGITSWVRGGCAVGYPDVFTRVFYYLDWIDKHSEH